MLALKIKWSSKLKIAGNIMLLLLVCFSVVSCSSNQELDYSEDRGVDVDERSYQIGMLSGFAELVKLGLKPMAVSGSFITSDMDILFPDLEAIAKLRGINVYRETDPLQTDLESFDRAEIVIFYTGDTLNQYLALKNEKRNLEQTNQYQGNPRLQISVKLGKLMGYSDEAIEIWLNSQH